MNDDSDQHSPLPEPLLRSLRNDITPPPVLEARTVRALRIAQVLGAQPTRSIARWPLIGIRVAAAAALFTAGVLLGQRLPGRTAAAATSLDVQEAGTAYVAALVRLSQAANGNQPHNLVAGLEAGTATLRAAAVSLSRINPGDPVVRRIRNSLDAAAISGNGAPSAPTDSTIIRY